MSNQRFAVGLNAVLVTIFAAAIAVGINEIAHRHRYRIDVSADALATLDPDTIAALSLIAARGGGDPVTITAFGAQAKGSEAWLRDRMMRDFLRALQAASPDVRTRFVDFDRDRMTAEQLGVDRYGTVVVEGAGDRVDIIDRHLFRARGPKGDRDVSFIGEAAIAAAIRQVLSRATPVVVSLKGHGEDEIYDRGLGELRALAARIDEQGFRTRTVDLVRDAPPGAAPEIPADAAVVLILGGSVPLARPEADALRDWLGRGGSVAWFVDPGDPAPALLEEIGLDFPPGVALDEKSFFPHRDRPILQFGRHPITEALAEGGVQTVVAHARPIRIGARDGVSAGTLMQTSRRGWIERGSEQPPVYDADQDGAGPAIVAAALTVGAPHPWSRPGTPQARVVVIGDVDFARDELLEDAPGNATLVANVLRWLARTDESLARVGRPARVRRLALGNTQLRAIRIVLMIGMPSLAAAAGIAVAAYRRSR